MSRFVYALSSFSGTHSLRSFPLVCYIINVFIKGGVCVCIYVYACDFEDNVMLPFCALIHRLVLGLPMHSWKGVFHALCGSFAYRWLVCPCIPFCHALVYNSILLLHFAHPMFRGVFVNDSIIYSQFMESFST